MCRPSSQWLWICKLSHWDNQLIFGDIRLQHMHPYEVLLDEGFYGRPIFLETEPDQEFLGFMLETRPLELTYCGPTRLSQVLSPFSASPPKVLLSGFRFRCHIVVKGAFPAHRVQQGRDQLIHLYTLAGFSEEELNSISSQIVSQHQLAKEKLLVKLLTFHVLATLSLSRLSHVFSLTLLLLLFEFLNNLLGFFPW
jgi:hypothetical protein